MYTKNPKLFHFYYGDYKQMFINYFNIRENAEFIIENVIERARIGGDYDICYDACNKLTYSYFNGYIKLNGITLDKLLYNHVLIYIKTKNIKKKLNGKIDTCSDVSKLVSYLQNKIQVKSKTHEENAYVYIKSYNTKRRYHKKKGCHGANKVIALETAQDQGREVCGNCKNFK